MNDGPKTQIIDQNGNKSPAALLIGDADPHNKIDATNKINTKTEFPQGEQKKQRGRPPTHGLSRTPIYTSFVEARRRCTDPKHPDYERYGGRGIEFRIKSVDELHKKIGDRPLGKTLDRIDSNGHYELENVRWSDAKEQANNRARPSRGRDNGAADWSRSADVRQSYLQAARHWDLSIAFINNPLSASGADFRFLAERHAATGIPHASFEPFQEYTGKEPGHLLLPSLNHPGQKVIVQGGPLVQGTRRSNNGLLNGMEHVPVALNCSAEECDAFQQFARDVKSGDGLPALLFTGELGFSANRIEGRLLAMAGRIGLVGLKSRVLLVADVARLLALNDIEALLAPDCFFLPDLQMWPSTFGSDLASSQDLSSALQQRARARLPTVVYVEDGGSFPSCRSLFATAYRGVNISKSIPPAHSLPATNGKGPHGKPTRTLAEVVARSVELRSEYE